MPLNSAGGRKTRSENIKKVLSEYKKTGKIGTSKPRSMAQAQRQAAAIAYSKQRRK